MNIRQYTPNDYEELVALLKVNDMYFEATDDANTINTKSKNDPESIIIATVDGVTVGCAFIVCDGWANFIYHIAVYPEYQNQGIGSALLKHAEDLIKSRGGNCIIMYVMSDNTNALELYDRRGYESLPGVTCVYKVTK